MARLAQLAQLGCRQCCHATVRRVGDGFLVEDAGSLNGTYVNQSRVENAALSDGDEVQIGKFKLVYLDLGSRT